MGSKPYVMEQMEETYGLNVMEKFMPWPSLSGINNDSIDNKETILR